MEHHWKKPLLVTWGLEPVSLVPVNRHASHSTIRIKATLSLPFIQILIIILTLWTTLFLLYKNIIFSQRTNKIINWANIFSSMWVESVVFCPVNNFVCSLLQNYVIWSLSVQTILPLKFSCSLRRQQRASSQLM